MKEDISFLDWVHEGKLPYRAVNTVFTHLNEIYVIIDFLNYYLYSVM